MLLRSFLLLVICLTALPLLSQHAPGLLGRKYFVAAGVDPSFRIGADDAKGMTPFRLRLEAGTFWSRLHEISVSYHLDGFDGALNGLGIRLERRAYFLNYRVFASKAAVAPLGVYAQLSAGVSTLNTSLNGLGISTEGTEMGLNDLNGTTPSVLLGLGLRHAFNERIVLDLGAHLTVDGAKNRFEETDFPPEVEQRLRRVFRALRTRDSLRIRLGVMVAL